VPSSTTLPLKDSGWPQCFPEENKEAPTQEVKEVIGFARSAHVGCNSIVSTIEVSISPIGPADGDQ
jgi:hypothetical protein